jgi:hypothetical protein
MEIKVNINNNEQFKYTLEKETIKDSKYFDSLKEDKNIDTIIDIPVYYSKEVYDYIFGITNQINIKNILDYFNASNYFDLRSNDILEYIKKLSIKNVDILFTNTDILYNLLEINKIVKLQWLTSYIIGYTQQHLDEAKQLYLTSNNYIRSLYSKYLYQIVNDFKDPSFLLVNYLDNIPNNKKLCNSKNVDLITKKFHTLTYELFRDFDWNNVVIAGGLILESIFEETLNEHTDVDIWVYGEDQKSTINRILEHINATITKLNKRLYISHKGSVIYFWIDDFNRSFQIINTNYKTKFDIINSFDFDCCHILYDGKDILCTYNFLDAIKTMNTQYNTDFMLNEMNYEHFYRINKKGFNSPMVKNEEYLKYISDNKNNLEMQNYMHFYPNSKDNIFKNMALLKAIYKLSYIESNIDIVTTTFDYTNTINNMGYGSSIPHPDLWLIKYVSKKNTNDPNISMYSIINQKTKNTITYKFSKLINSRNFKIFINNDLQYGHSLTKVQINKECIADNILNIFNIANEKTMQFFKLDNNVIGKNNIYYSSVYKTYLNNEKKEINRISIKPVKILINNIECTLSNSIDIKKNTLYKVSCVLRFFVWKTGKHLGIQLRTNEIIFNTIK